MNKKIITREDPLKIEEKADINIIKLLDLTDKQEKTINPLVAPTSGIRMEIYEKEGETLVMKEAAQHMFLRVFKAVSMIGKQELKKETPNVLITSDDRPSANYLVEYCSKIFAQDGYNIYFQTAYDDRSKQDAEGTPYYSRMGAPHGSASLSLIDDIDLVVVLTASHNGLLWNGIKFYIEMSIPISGRVMRTVAEKAIGLKEIPLAKEISPVYINADEKNNNYIIDMANEMIDLSVLKGRKVVVWPYMGRAPEIVNLFERVGMEVVLIEEQMEPPNPTVNLNHVKIEQVMIKEKVKIAILLDTDRDRVVIIHRNEKNNTFETLLPNALYTAMHNLLITEFNNTIINVRTIPSDPRCDKTAQLNLIAGVGYKHLGMIIYGALGKPIDNEKFQTGILYVETNKGYQKIKTPEGILEAIKAGSISGEKVIMALWEESGGHTFNILDFKEEDGKLSCTTRFPAIGDKYPASAILIICTLFEMGHDLIASIDGSILGTRTLIDAEDEKKVEIISTFAKMAGKKFQVGDKEYTVGTFEQVNGEVRIIHLFSENSNIYFRPSGTGPNVRIYIFGKKDTVNQELDAIKIKIDEMFQ